MEMPVQYIPALQLFHSRPQICPVSIDVRHLIYTQKHALTI